jgi:hypothetical protein
VIACIEDPAVINKILDYLDRKAAASEQKRLPESRAPPLVECTTAGCHEQNSIFLNAAGCMQGVVCSKMQGYVCETNRLGENR